MNLDLAKTRQSIATLNKHLADVMSERQQKTAALGLMSAPKCRSERRRISLIPLKDRHYL